MPQSLSEIEKAIQSNDEAILLRSLEFAYRCRQREYDRGRMAQARATATLAILGVLVGLLVLQGGSLPGKDDGSFWYLAASYVIPLLFFARGDSLCLQGTRRDPRAEGGGRHRVRLPTADPGGGSSI